jgi:hypothetical protein
MFGVHALTQKDITKLMTSSLCTLVNCGMKMLCATMDRAPMMFPGARSGSFRAHVQLNMR